MMKAAAHLADKSTLMIYRDCLKVVNFITDEPDKVNNIRNHFRLEFKKQREVTSEEEHVKFREGMVRLLSNYMLFDIKRQYKENPD